jgi:DnaJ-class molecular chaperone
MKKVEKKKEKKVCPVCHGKGFDDNSSEEDKCNHCGGTGKWKEIK